MMMARYINPKIRSKFTIRVFVVALSVLAMAGFLATCASYEGGSVCGFDF